MGDKASEIGDNDAIILQKQCFYVSGQFNHDAKITDLSDKSKTCLVFLINKK